MQKATDFKPGDRVRLISMNDPHRKTPVGIEGTVISAVGEPINVVNVDWDDGFGLNPCLDEDVIIKVG